jgi:hypothetical protein
VVKDLNADGATGVMKDYNDWANLALPFVRGPYNSGRSNVETPHSPVTNPVTDDRQPAAEEFAPSTALFEELRRIR